MNHVDNPNQRFLALTGVILESDYNLYTVQPEMDVIKRKFFQHDPDEPVIFHRKEIVNHRPPFIVLRNQEIKESFNDALLSVLRDWKYNVVTVVIDKKAHRDQYSIWHYQPYHYCLAVMLERFILFLHYQGVSGDVMVESRGGLEDRRLKDSYKKLFESGTDKISAKLWQECLTSKELKVKPKSSNITGLQLADLIAHPSCREILLDNKLIRDSRKTFGDKISAILRADKYLRSSQGKIEGYGKKLLP